MKLKSAIAFLVAIPVIAFGQVNKEICFEATKAVKHAPSKLCFVNVEEDNAPGVLKVVSADINVPEKLNVTTLSRNNEDRYRFKAEGLIAEDWTMTCGYGFIALLKIQGESAYNYISVEALNVSVEVESVKDSCHEIGREVNTVEYKLVK